MSNSDFVEFLKCNGLSDEKWIAKFAENDVTSEDNLLAVKSTEGARELYESFINVANDNEQKILQRLLGISEENEVITIHSHLDCVGLDVTYWTKVFSDKFGITTANALKYVGEEAFPVLGRCVRKEWERRALRELLKFDKNEKSQIPNRKHQKERLVQRLEEANQLLQHLKEFSFEGKDRGDTGVKQTESEICEMLQIPQHSWFHEDVSLNDLISHLEAREKIINSVMTSRSEISDEMVVRNASGGLALTGIFLTRKLEDQLGLRSDLLQVPQQVSLLRPVDDQRSWTEHFSSRLEEELYMKRCSMLGYSASVPMQSGFWELQFSINAAHSTKITDPEQSICGGMYYSTVKHISLPLASICLGDKDMNLSRDALSYLSIIESKISSHGYEHQEVQKACEAFFKRFGSHVNRGPLHFGGMYWLKCYSTMQSESEQRFVKELQCEAVNTPTTLPKVTDISSVKTMHFANCSEMTIAQTHLEVVKSGSLLDSLTMNGWSTSLVASNSTWALIDRGTVLVPVWEIISKNYHAQFTEAANLVKALYTTWENIAGLKVQFSSMCHPSEITHVTDVVTQWNQSNSMSQEQIQEYLNALISVKCGIVKTFMSPEAWPSIYLTQPPIQQFLKAVYDAQQVTPTPLEAECVKEHMQHLLQLNDLKHDFPYREDFIQWLYGSQNQLTPTCLDVIGFSRYLDLAVDKMTELQEKQISTNGKPSSNRFYDYQTSAAISREVNSLLQNLRESAKPEFIFVITLVYPFIYEYFLDHSVVLKLLSLNDIVFLSKILKSQKREFYRRLACDSSLRTQAFLFHLAVDIYSNESQIDLNEAQVKWHLQFLQEVLGNDLNDLLKQALHPYFHSGIDWRKLQSDLFFFANCTNSKELRQQSNHSLEHVLNDVPTRTRLIIQSSAVDICEATQASKDSTELSELFDALNLMSYYPKKLSMKFALGIRQYALGNCKCSDSTKLPQIILHKIMTYDSRCRTELFEGFLDDSDSDDDDRDLNKCSVSYGSYISAVSYFNRIHPMDGLLSVMLCADDFLRQDLMARLATSQFAIPFILPDPFTNQLTLTLWSMKTIVKEWKCTLNGQQSVNEGPITCYKLPIVSFVRLSKQTRSKSKAMNSVISDSNHDHFFHRDLEGGLVTQLLGDGFVDVCWYLPAGKQGDIFPDAIMFLNLHGDARRHPRQVRFLSKISFMTFMFISEDDLSETSLEENEQQCPSGKSVLEALSSSVCGLVLLADKVPKEGELDAVQKAYSSNVWTIKMEDKNDDMIKKKIRERINKTVNGRWQNILSKMLSTDSEEFAEISRSCGIAADTDSKELKEGKELANAIDNIITSHNDPVLSVKEAMLPLQGKNMWIKWASLDKEEHRQINRGGEKFDKYGLRKMSEKKQVRKLQLQRVQNLTPLIESFIVSILQTAELPVVRNYYLQCVKLILNNLSREKITSLQKRYKEKRNKLRTLQGKKEVNQDAVKECKVEIEDLHEEMINASLGLEHLLRELGQVYEALQEFKGSEVEQFSRLPQAAAELLIDGYPLEIMDGDAAHVPTKWVSAVLNELGKLLNDPDVFILSVLGLQSTGKSTLMNTAFGLQFNVSAGRCTRGAFMQLLPISEELKKVVKCEYILVIDTEGLRAPELDSQKTQTHDNELATFVIGLADVTLINIFGESPGDMDDILQTVVHAFIRMASVNLNPSCQFVHQNVGALLASAKGDMGRSRFKDKLDAMTSAAANEENCEGRYEYFSDVIQFNDSQDVHHFPGLWRGDPPMAPVNPGYSENAQLLVSHLLKLIKEKQKKGSHQVSTFKTRLEDLWKALLNESFVFSFKNTMERKVYNSLEAEYIQWSWSFKRQMLEWQQTAENKIKSIKKKNELEIVQETLLQDLPVVVTKIHEEIKAELTKYFEESRQREMLAQWQRDAQARVERLSQEENDRAKDLCIQLTAAQMARAEVEDLNKEYRLRMLVRLKEDFEAVEAEIKQRIAKRMKTVSPEVNTVQMEEDIKEQELHEKFSSLWKVWIEEISGTLPHHRDNTDVESDAQAALSEYFRSHSSSVITGIQTKSLHHRGGELTTMPMRPQFVDIKRKRSTSMITWVKDKAGVFFKNHSKPVATAAHMKLAASITEDIFGKVRQYVLDIRNQDYRAIHFQEILRLIMEAINCHTAREECEIILTQQYRVEVSLAACGFAVGQFDRKVEAARVQNDPIAYLEKELRKPLYDLFKSKYNHTSQDKATASIFCESFVKPLRLQVMNSLSRCIITNIVHRNECLQTKLALLRKILLDLGEEVQTNGNLSNYKVYLKDPERALKEWITRYTFQHCMTEGEDKQTNLVHVATSVLHSTVQTIQGCITDAERKYKTHSKLKLGTWLDCVHENLYGKLQLDFDVFDTLTKEVESLNDVESFSAEVQSGMRQLHKGLSQELENCELLEEMILVVKEYNTDHVERYEIDPHTKLFDELRGCPECCPFCGEQCEQQIKDHEVKHHVSTIPHRPSCVVGYRSVATGVLTSDICTTLVLSEISFRNNDTNGQYHPYKEYKSLYPKWEITGDWSVNASSYWKWFLGNYGRQLAQEYGAIENDIFEDWKRNFKWEDAKKELENN